MVSSALSSGPGGGRLPIAPFPAGGSVDLVARAVAQQMSEAWKQPVLVANRPGASGNIGAVAAATVGLADLGPEDQLRVDDINALLDAHIRPYLRGDGGDLHVIGLEGNQLAVHYQGACGTCPSSISGTLAAIENLVKSIEPDIEVVAV